VQPNNNYSALHLATGMVYKFEKANMQKYEQLNHHLSQKLKLVEIDEFNHLINTLTRANTK
jgi:hypothetical protein